MVMPTARPRHLVTETDRVAQALDDAAARWPEDRDRRARLLVRLVLEGHQALQDETDRRHAQRAEAARRTSGALTDVYGDGYLEELRQDWPA